jgi:hypothetical protein
MVDLSTSTAPQSGATVTVTSGTGTLLAVGQLHAPASLGNGGPSPSSGQR